MLHHRCHHHHQDIRLLNNRQNAVVQTEMKRCGHNIQKSVYKSVNTRSIIIIILFVHKTVS